MDAGRYWSELRRRCDLGRAALFDKQRTILDKGELVKAVQDIVKYVADKMYVLSSEGRYKCSLIQPRVRNHNYSDSLGSHTEISAKIWMNG